MTSKEKSILKSLLLFVLIVAVGVVVVILYRQKTSETAQASGNEPSIAISPASESSKVTTTSVHSAKAQYLLTLRATHDPNGTTNYSFFVSDISGASPRLLFEKTLGPHSSMSIPLNSWDPTDTYVFLEERDQGYVTYYVFKANGDSFDSNQRSIDVGNVWNQKKMPYAIREATGWASGSLLIIYTTKDDGSSGPHYWFEIPSTAILILAS